jgi:hypothetical protein
MKEVCSAGLCGARGFGRNTATIQIDEVVIGITAAL